MILIRLTQASICRFCSQYKSILTQDERQYNTSDYDEKTKKTKFALFDCRKEFENM